MSVRFSSRSDLNMQNRRVENQSDPVNPQDGATRAFVLGSIIFKGAYLNTSAYITGSIVSFNSNFYIANTDIAASETGRGATANPDVSGAWNILTAGDVTSVTDGRLTIGPTEPTTGITDGHIWIDTSGDTNPTLSIYNSATSTFNRVTGGGVDIPSDTAFPSSPSAGDYFFLTVTIAATSENSAFPQGLYLRNSTNTGWIAGNDQDIFAGDYLNTEGYPEGEIVAFTPSGGSQNFYIARHSIPPVPAGRPASDNPDQNTASWALLTATGSGDGNLREWDASTAYAQGDQVIYNQSSTGNLWSIYVVVAEAGANANGDTTMNPFERAADEWRLVQSGITVLQTNGLDLETNMTDEGQGFTQNATLHINQGDGIRVTRRQTQFTISAHGSGHSDADEFAPGWKYSFYPLYGEGYQTGIVSSTIITSTITRVANVESRLFIDVNSNSFVAGQDYAFVVSGTELTTLFPGYTSPPAEGIIVYGYADVTNPMTRFWITQLDPAVGTFAELFIDAGGSGNNLDRSFGAITENFYALEADHADNSHLPSDWAREQQDGNDNNIPIPREKIVDALDGTAPTVRIDGSTAVTGINNSWLQDDNVTNAAVDGDTLTLTQADETTVEFTREYIRNAVLSGTTLNLYRTADTTGTPVTADLSDLADFPFFHFATITGDTGRNAFTGHGNRSVFATVSDDTGDGSADPQGTFATYVLVRPPAAGATDQTTDNADWERITSPDTIINTVCIRVWNPNANGGAGAYENQSLGTVTPTTGLTEDDANRFYLRRDGNLDNVADSAVALGNLGGAPLASPTFTGTPAGPTAASGTNTTQLATTAYVQGEVYDGGYPARRGFAIENIGAIEQLGANTFSWPGGTSRVFGEASGFTYEPGTVRQGTEEANIPGVFRNRSGADVDLSLGSVYVDITFTDVPDTGLSPNVVFTLPSATSNAPFVVPLGLVVQTGRVTASARVATTGLTTSSWVNNGTMGVHLSVPATITENFSYVVNSIRFSRDTNDFTRTGSGGGTTTFQSLSDVEFEAGTSFQEPRFNGMLLNQGTFPNFTVFYDTITSEFTFAVSFDENFTEAELTTDFFVGATVTIESDVNPNFTTDLVGTVSRAVNGSMNNERFITIRFTSGQEQITESLTIEGVTWRQDGDDYDFAPSVSAEDQQRFTRGFLTGIEIRRNGEIEPHFPYWNNPRSRMEVTGAEEYRDRLQTQPVTGGLSVSTQFPTDAAPTGESRDNQLSTVRGLDQFLANSNGRSLFEHIETNTPDLNTFQGWTVRFSTAPQVFYIWQPNAASLAANTPRAAGSYTPVGGDTRIRTTTATDPNAAGVTFANSGNALIIFNVTTQQFWWWNTGTNSWVELPNLAAAQRLVDTAPVYGPALNYSVADSVTGPGLATYAESTTTMVISTTSRNSAAQATVDITPFIMNATAGSVVRILPSATVAHALTLASAPVINTSAGTATLTFTSNIPATPVLSAGATFSLSFNSVPAIGTGGGTPLTADAVEALDLDFSTTNIPQIGGSNITTADGTYIPVYFQVNNSGQATDLNLDPTTDSTHYALVRRDGYDIINVFNNDGTLASNAASSLNTLENTDPPRVVYIPLSGSGGGSGTVTSVGTGTGLTGGPITTTGTIDLEDTLVTPGSYTAADITVDQQGRITAAASSSEIPVLRQDINEEHTTNVNQNSRLDTQQSSIDINSHRIDALERGSGADRYHTHQFRTATAGTVSNPPATELSEYRSRDTGTTSRSWPVAITTAGPSMVMTAGSTALPSNVATPLNAHLREVIHLNGGLAAYSFANAPTTFTNATGAFISRFAILLVNNSFGIPLNIINNFRSETFSHEMMYPFPVDSTITITSLSVRYFTATTSFVYAPAVNNRLTVPLTPTQSADLRTRSGTGNLAVHYTPAGGTTIVTENITAVGADVASGVTTDYVNVDLTLQGQTPGSPLLSAPGTDIAIADAASMISSLGTLTDVTISSLADDQVLTYDSASGMWTNQAAQGGGGGSNPTFETVTIDTGFRLQETSLAGGTIPGTPNGETNTISNAEITSNQLYVLIPSGATLVAGTEYILCVSAVNGTIASRVPVGVYQVTWVGGTGNNARMNNVRPVTNGVVGSAISLSGSAIGNMTYRFHAIGTGTSQDSLEIQNISSSVNVLQVPDAGDSVNIVDFVGIPTVAGEPLATQEWVQTSNLSSINLTSPDGTQTATLQLDNNGVLRISGAASVVASDFIQDPTPGS